MNITLKHTQVHTEEYTVFLPKVQSTSNTRMGVQMKLCNVMNEASKIISIVDCFSFENEVFK